MTSEELKREVARLEQAIRDAIETSEDVHCVVEKIREAGLPIALHLMCLFGQPNSFENEFEGQIPGAAEVQKFMAQFSLDDAPPAFDVTDDDHVFLDDLGIRW